MKNILQKLKPHWPPVKLILTGSLIMLLIHFLKLKGGWIKVIDIVGAILVIIGLIKWKLYFEKKDKEEDPYFDDDPVYEKGWEKMLHYGSVFFAIIGFFCLPIATMWTENLIQEEKFMLTSILGGIVSVAAVYWLAKKKFPFVFIKNATRYKELNLTGFGMVFHAVNLMALITFLPAPVSSRLLKVPIVEHGQAKSMVYIWVSYHGETMKLRPNREDYQLLKGKDSTTLVISKSVLGFEYTCKMLAE